MVYRVRGADSNCKGPRLMRLAVQELFAIEKRTFENGNPSSSQCSRQTQSRVLQLQKFPGSKYSALSESGCYTWSTGTSLYWQVRPNYNVVVCSSCGSFSLRRYSDSSFFFAVLRPAPWHAPACPPALHFPPGYRYRERDPSLSVTLVAKRKKAKPAGESEAAKDQQSKLNFPAWRLPPVENFLENVLLQKFSGCGLWFLSVKKSLGSYQLKHFEQKLFRTSSMGSHGRKFPSEKIFRILLQRKLSGRKTSAGGKF